MHGWHIEAHRPDFHPMGREQRRHVLPANGFCGTTPATDYTDGLRAAANGICMYAFGKPYEEQIVVTHEGLYYTTFDHKLDVPELSGILDEVRRLLREGKSIEANKLSIEVAERYGYRGLGESDRPFDAWHRHPACVIAVHTEASDDARDYLRTLDFDSGEASVYFTDARGQFERHALVDAQSNTCAQLWKNPADIEQRISLPFGHSGGNHAWDRMTAPIGSRVDRFSHEGCMILGCEYDRTCMKGRGYGVLVRAVAKKGRVEISPEELIVHGAGEVQVFSRVVVLDDYTEDKLKQAATAFAQEKLDYGEMRESNQQIIAPQMARSKVRLDKPEGDALLSIEELIEQQHTQSVSSALVEKLYDMGRYFLITETGTRPPQIGQYNININLQVCAGNSTGLWDQMGTFFRFTEAQFLDFERNARALFGCRGILMPIHPYPENGLLTHFSYSWPHHYWIACAAWVYNEFWNHYLVTGDKAFLQDHVLPGLEQIALFFEDYLSDRDENGKLMFYPGMSPECTPPGGAYSSLMMNSTMDIMACAEVLQNLLDGFKELQIHHEKLPLWRSMLDDLPPLRLDDEGGLKEWALKGVPEDYNHRCVSHHYALWPAHMVSWERDPELARAIQISGRKRAQENDSAHGIMHRLFCAIRLKDLPDTEQNFRQIMEHGFIRTSLMTNHYPHAVYFPDITGSYPAVIAEMALYSEPGLTEFLPAMPDGMGKGEVAGICLYNFCRVEWMAWNLALGELEVTLTSIRDQQMLCRCRRGIERGIERAIVDEKPVDVNGTEFAIRMCAERPVTLRLSMGRCKIYDAKLRCDLGCAE